LKHTLASHLKNALDERSLDLLYFEEEMIFAMRLA
jgi:hypothetical protein